MSVSSICVSRFELEECVDAGPEIVCTAAMSKTLELTEENVEFVLDEVNSVRKCICIG